MQTILSGKTALVLGGSKGIGQACAAALASVGATVIALARQKGPLVDAVQALQTETQRTHYYWVADTTQREAVRDALANVLKEHQIDILINQVARPVVGPMAVMREGHYAAAFEQTVQMSVMLASQLLPGMQARQFGRIINVLAPFQAALSVPQWGVLNTFHAAVLAWGKSLSGELVGSGVTVNTVFTSVKPEARETEAMDAVSASTVFLASPAASGITGAEI